MQAHSYLGDQSGLKWRLIRQRLRTKFAHTDIGTTQVWEYKSKPHANRQDTACLTEHTNH